MDYLINGLTQKEGNILYEFYFNELKFCGCGCPENTLLFIKNLLNIIYEKTKRCDNKDYYDRHYYYYDLYQKELREVFEFENKQENNSYFSNNQDGIIQFVLYYLDEVEVIEHGTSINGAWLTKKGEQILKILNKVEDWDNMSFEDYWNFLYTWLKKSKQIMKPSSTIWVFGTYHNIGLVNTIFQLLNIEILNEIIWYKRNAFPNLTCSRFTASHESILWGHLPTEKNEYTFNYDIMKDTDFPEDKLKEKGKQMRDVWDIPNNKTKEELQYKHPTQKPERLIRRCILASTKEGDLVFDPFGGSFTTAKVAMELGRRFISCDINDKYVEIGKKRINDLIHKLNC